MSTNDCCRDEIRLLEEELRNWETKAKQLRKDYHNSLIENLEKDVTIKELRDKISKLDKYKAFETILSQDVLKEIRSIGESQREDSEFVYVILNTFYGDSLAQKRIGDSKCIGKKTISPRKKKYLVDLFEERIVNTAENFEARQNSLSKCIRNAIDRKNRQL